jgi:dTDP-glucose pyrophosphorylase
MYGDGTSFGINLNYLTQNKKANIKTKFIFLNTFCYEQQFTH